MKHRILVILGLGLLVACTYRPREKRLAKYMGDGSKIIESFYRKTNNTIEFKRILSNGTKLKIQSGQIFLGDYAITNQKLETIEPIGSGDHLLDSVRSQIKIEGFVEKIIDDRFVMFVQIVPDSAMDDLDAFGLLNLRQNIEEKIDHTLKQRKLGEWFAGDSANMLFYVDNWNKSIEAVGEVLKDENLLDHVLIAKRIMTTNEDWSYEVVFPIEYQGVFNQM